MDTEKLTSRRHFLRLSGGLAAGVVLPVIPSAVQAAPKGGGNPVEELMREHGVLRRVLLIYDETANSIRNKRELPQGVIKDSASLIRRYVHDYHEKLEEEEIFPRLANVEGLRELIGILTAQHVAGRRLTDYILETVKPVVVKHDEPKTEEKKMPAAVAQIYGGTPLITHMLGKETPEMVMTESGIPHSKQGMLVSIEHFVRMYRPHAAREDTVLFTAFQSAVSPREFVELGQKFKSRERELFGERGFEKIVESVADIEKKLGIYNLSKFTATA
jgi:hemerythrin-like domain-containing protein